MLLQPQKRNDLEFAQFYESSRVYARNLSREYIWMYTCLIRGSFRVTWYNQQVM